MMKTQVMKTRGLKLFYLFRKVFGFLFLFGLTLNHSQTTLSGSVVIIDKAPTNKNSTIHIASVANVCNCKKSTKSAVAITKRISRNIIKVTKWRYKQVLAELKLKKFNKKFHSTSEDQAMLIFNTEYNAASIATGQTYKKQIAVFSSWHFKGSVLSYSSKVFSLSVKREMHCLQQRFRGRPPPI